MVFMAWWPPFLRSLNDTTTVYPVIIIKHEGLPWGYPAHSFSKTTGKGSVVYLLQNTGIWSAPVTLTSIEPFSRNGFHVPYGVAAKNLFNHEIPLSSYHKFIERHPLFHHEPGTAGEG
jgi:hypothetical protein